MPNTLKFTLVYLLVLLPQQVLAFGPQRLQLSTQEWPPYQTYVEGKIAGIGVNRLKCVLRKIEQPYQITMTSWAKAQVNVQSGKHHGLFTTEQSPERDKYATFSAPLVNHHWYWYFSNSLTDTNLSAENKMLWRVSTKFGTNKWFYLHNAGYQVVKKPRNVKTLLDMLLHNDVDAILVDDLALQLELKRQGLSADSFKRKLVATKPLGVYFQNTFLQNYPNFLPGFNRAVTSCVEQL